MANNERLGASFSIDVTNLKAGLAQANRLIRESNSEFQAAAAGMDDWTKSEDGLNAKIKSLNQITEIQRQKVDALQGEYDRLISNGMDPASKEAVELRTKINNETTALNKNEAELKKQEKALDELEDETEDVSEATDDAGDKFEGLKAAGGVAVGAIAAVGAACVAAVTAFLGLAESTREARTNMAKLETGFTQAGLSAEDATNTYNELYSVLGDDGQATEAAAHLAQLTNNQEELSIWTDICTGIYATFGDSLPIEGLTEAANETAKTGAITGNLADALNWAGVSEDDFQASLDACTTEQERQALITSTLNGLYADSAAAYKENNAEVIAAQKAQAELNDALNELGAIAEPIMTTLKTLAADLLTTITPFVQLMGEGLAGALEGTAGAADKLAEGLNGILTTALDMVVDMIPFLIDTIVAIIPTLLTELLNKLPMIITTVIDIVIQVIDAITEMLPEILPAITSCIMQIIDRLVMAIPDLLEAAIKFFTAIVDALPTIIDGLLASLNDIITTLIWGLINALPDLLQAAIQFFNAIIQAIPTIIEMLAFYIPNIIDTIIEGLTEAIPLLLDAAIQLLNAIIDAIPTIIQALTENLPTIIEAIINGVIDAIPLLLDAAIQLLMAIVDAIPSIIDALVNDLPHIILTITGTLLANLPKLINAAVQLFFGILEAIPKIQIELIKQMPQIIVSIVKGLSGGIKDIVKVGGDIIRGLWEGISDMADWIAKKIKGFGESVLGGIKDFFGIHSPSDVMADQVGKNLALGIGEGFEKNIAGVNKEIIDAMNFDDASVNVNAARGGAKGGGVTVYQTNNYKQAFTSQIEKYKSKQQLYATARLIKAGAI